MGKVDRIIKIYCIGRVWASTKPIKYNVKGPSPHPHKKARRYPAGKRSEAERGRNEVGPLGGGDGLAHKKLNKFCKFIVFGSVLGAKSLINTLKI